MKNLFKFLAGLALFVALFSVYGYGQANIALGSQVSGGQVTPAAPSGGAATFSTVGIGDGTAAAPSLYFTADTNTGIFRPATDTFGIAAGGVDSAWFTSTAWQGLSTLTSGIQLYNTADAVTNYERIEMRFLSNVATLQTVFGGTGTARGFRVSAWANTASTDGPSIRLLPSPTPGSQSFFEFTKSTAISSAGITVGNLVFSNSTTSAGTNVGFAITPTYNQASGSAANTDLLINRTQTAVGSGTQLLIDAQVSSSSQFSVDNAGLVTVQSNGGYLFNSRGRIKATGDGVFALLDSSQTTFSRLVFGGTTASFPALKRSSGTLQFRLADDSADANMSAAAGTFSGAVTSSSGSGGVGYATGAGGTVTQTTSKATGVTLNTVTGQITLNAASLAAGTSVSFTVTDSAVAAKDVIIPNIASGATAASYTITIDAVAAGSFRVHLRNESAGALAEALVVNFAVIKGA